MTRNEWGESSIQVQPVFSWVKEEEEDLTLQRHVMCMCFCTQYTRNWSGDTRRRCQSAIATGANVQLSGCIWVPRTSFTGFPRILGSWLAGNPPVLKNDLPVKVW